MMEAKYKDANYEAMKPLGRWVHSFDFDGFVIINGRFEFIFNKEILN